MADPAGTALRDKMKAERAAWQQKTKDEHDDIENRTRILHSFIQSGDYYGVSDHEKGLLTSQLGHMQAYLATLKQRIKYHNQS